MRRRTLLKIGIGAPVGLAVGGAGGAVWWWTTSDVDTFGKVPFDRPLAIPPLAESKVEADGVRSFGLTAQESTADLVPAGRTGTWAYDGDYLGPTIRANVGEQVRVEIRNQLDEATTVHWHGMHVPARYDGGPHQSIDPGESWTPSWRIDQLPATLWYHPHPHGQTEKHVYRGLAGLFILDDATSAVLDQLPHRYGVDDIPMIVQDRSFDDDGGFDRQHYGDTILVNGTYGPYLDVTTQAVRLRLLNACTARVFEFGLSDGRSFEVVATDGGLLPGPVSMHRLRMSPGERAEIVVRVRPREQVNLRSYPPDLGMDRFSAAGLGGRDQFEILQLRSADSVQPSPAVPKRLAKPPGLDPTTATRTRAFELQGGRQINDKSMDMERIDETVTVDTTEIWEVSNGDGNYHNFHAHDVQFQVLDVDGDRPPPELGGWKDTVLVEPGQVIRLVARFADYTDPDLPYMYHCHLLHHEDRGMMGQFTVVAASDP